MRAYGCETLLDIGLRECGAEISALHAVDRVRHRAGLARMNVIDRERRAQRAAGITRRRLNPDPAKAASRSTLPLATQLSATPPARHRFSIPVSSARLRVRRSTTSSSTAWMEAAMSMCLCVEPAFGIARGAAEQRVEARIGHRQPGAIVEIVEVEPEGAVRLEVDQVVADQFVVFRRRHRAQAPSACIRPNSP